MKKTARIATLIERCQGMDYDAHYLGFFECFNQGLFYESHEVLEELWLTERKGPNDAFYKGLIQLAGAFVHLQKNRLRPAGSLFKLAKANLEKYPTLHHGLKVIGVLQMIKDWLQKLEVADFNVNPIDFCKPPELKLHQNLGSSAPAPSAGSDRN